MSPAHLRAKHRVTVHRMALDLGCTVADVHALERTELPSWKLRDLARYVGALGYAVRIVAVNAHGRETELA